MWITGVVDTGEKLINGVVATGDQFIAGVVVTGEHLSPSNLVSTRQKCSDSDVDNIVMQEKLTMMHQT